MKLNQESSVNNIQILNQNLRTKTKNYFVRYRGGLMAMGIILLLWIFVCPSFYKINNISNMLRYTSYSTMLTYGMTLCLIMGSIDLSIASIMSFGGVLTVMMINNGMIWWLAIIIGVVASALIGLINGILVAKTGAPAFVITVAMNTVISGLTLILSGGGDLQIGSNHAFEMFGKGTFFDIIPYSLIYLIVVTIIMYLVLEKTRFGSWLFACGSNAIAANYSGVGVSKCIIIGHTICGTLAGLAGTIISSRLMAAPTMLTLSYDTDAIAGAVLGGVLFEGGEGHIGGALIGALCMGVISNGLNVWGLSNYWQYIVKGVIFIVVVSVDVVTSRKRHQD